MRNVKIRSSEHPDQLSYGDGNTDIANVKEKGRMSLLTLPQVSAVAGVGTHSPSLFGRGFP
jgi:hypothetical protein